LGESNSAANRLANIAEKKCDMKAAYYEKKTETDGRKQCKSKKFRNIIRWFYKRKVAYKSLNN